VCLGYNNFSEDEMEEDERKGDSLGGCIGRNYWDGLIFITSSLLRARAE